jgi:hypothetical protein
MREHITVGIVLARLEGGSATRWLQGAVTHEQGGRRMKVKTHIKGGGNKNQGSRGEA